MKQGSENGKALMVFAVEMCLLIVLLLFVGRRFDNPAWSVLCGVGMAAVCGLLLTEKSRMDNARFLCMVAVMTTLAVLGRIWFALLPGFKPVTAIVILTGIYYGSRAGVMTGMLSALISNIYFMQGPWTPFQMLAWGGIGLLAGLLRNCWKRPILLGLFGAFSGILYSVVMDIWMVLWYQPHAGLAVYLFTFSTSLPSTMMYIVSNEIFLAVLAPALGRRMERNSQFVNI